MKEFLREYPQSFFDLGDILLKKSLGFIRNHLVLKILWRHRCLYTSLCLARWRGRCYGILSGTLPGKVRFWLAAVNRLPELHSSVLLLKYVLRFSATLTVFRRCISSHADMVLLFVGRRNRVYRTGSAQLFIFAYNSCCCVLRIIKPEFRPGLATRNSEIFPRSPEISR